MAEAQEKVDRDKTFPTDSLRQPFESLSTEEFVAKGDIEIGNYFTPGRSARISFILERTPNNILNMEGKAIRRALAIVVESLNGQRLKCEASIGNKIRYEGVPIRDGATQTFASWREIHPKKKVRTDPLSLTYKEVGDLYIGFSEV